MIQVLSGQLIVPEVFFGSNDTVLYTQRKLPQSIIEQEQHDTQQAHQRCKQQVACSMTNDPIQIHRGSEKEQNAEG